VLPEDGWFGELRAKLDAPDVGEETMPEEENFKLRSDDERRLILSG